jgi:formamidopyrimidine-DNA glycosylase
MPEGPEIIITTQYLKSKIYKKKLESVKVISGRYTHQELKGLNLIDNAPLTIDEINSMGKFMWIKMTDSKGKVIYMLNTFGMSGRWTFDKNAKCKVKFTIRSKSDVSKTYDLYFADPRNFGTIEFTSDENVLLKKLDRLAPDVLKTELSDDDLVAMIKQYIKMTKKPKNIVEVLMGDQSAIVSGIGNYLIAEILYDARINPHRTLNDLSDSELKTLAHSMREISKCAYYNNDVGYMEYHKEFMKTHAQKVDSGEFPNYHPDIKIDKHFRFKVYQKDKDPFGNPVEHEEIIKGRTLHWVKKVQV